MIGNRNPRRRLEAMVLTALVFLLPMLGLLGCGGEAASVPAATMMMVDVQSGQTFSLPLPTTFPAVNPETQRRTLMPGLFCSTCQKWYPVPPPDQINRQGQAGMCPRSHGPLTADGPT
ncbi:hypothetical protein [Roseimaritima ulvae]|uniref:Uncharacterized protein n=1 Tax=Roseimaritima ulvae TaxID=980254 RepID=A0A5B9R5I5_9BACT|nr:hypothetical protein [Roseimaritima ulvae]QEG41473.1 hypothetical protein UC8_34950 [Roseimaritima ulvae]